MRRVVSILLFVVVLVLTGCGGGSDTDVVTVGIKQVLTTYDESTRIATLEVVLPDTVDDRAIVKVEWEFGDGTKAEGVRVVHKYPAGNFVATVNVYDSSGNVYTSQTTLMKFKADWLFLVYMAGDNSLSSQTVQDLEEMRSAYPFPTNFLVLTAVDTSANSGFYYYQVLPGVLKTLESFPEKDSGDFRTLEGFLSWAKATFKYDKVMLVLWDHGSGWLPSDRSIAIDATSNSHSIEIYELAQAVKSVFGKVSIIAFDACLMGMVEVGHDLKDVTDYVIASEDYEPATGWNYEKLFETFAVLDNFRENDIYNAVVDAYRASYEDDKTRTYTMAVYDMSQQVELEKAINIWAKTMCNLEDADFTNSVKVPFSTMIPVSNSSSYLFYDLNILKNKWSNAATLNYDFTDYVRKLWSTQSDYAGLSIAIPASDEISIWRDRYSSTLGWWATLSVKLRE